MSPTLIPLKAVASALLLVLTACATAPAGTWAPPAPVAETQQPWAPAPIPEPELPDIKLVEYTGKVEHIFFHPLIAYPELAFDGDSLSAGMDDWFVTVPEFRRILADLYRNNYILVHMTDVVDVGAAGVTVRRLMLPEGKKPLVISIDDMNYYTYMRENGVIHKLIVGDDGRIATFSKTPQGKERIGYDDEIVPLLDAFVAEHPDFSLRGAKATIALTGFEGILGYRTHKLGAPDYEQEKAAALQVVQRLKETGWTFASHSWSHLDMAKLSYDAFTRDLLRWQAEVEPLTGPTPVYIYPFGSDISPRDPKFDHLLKNGFRIMCAVGPAPWEPEDGRYATMERSNIDGISFRLRPRSLSHLMDVPSLVDPLRPKR